jgi:hypothetical protein
MEGLMMNSQNPQWNTPPDGDFARYVERLSAQALLPRRPAQEGEPGLDVGMTSQSPGAPGAATAQQQQRLASSNGEAPNAGATPAAQAALIARLGLGGALVLLVLWSLGVPLNVLGVILVVGLWLGFKLKRMKLPLLGPAKWQRVLEEAARKQKELQQRQAR